MQVIESQGMKLNTGEAGNPSMNQEQKKTTTRTNELRKQKLIRSAMSERKQKNTARENLIAKGTRSHPGLPRQLTSICLRRSPRSGRSRRRSARKSLLRHQLRRSQRRSRWRRNLLEALMLHITARVSVQVRSTMISRQLPRSLPSRRDRPKLRLAKISRPMMARPSFPSTRATSQSWSFTRRFLLTFRSLGDCRSCSNSS
mmetsp:Transcript_13101/g.46070  ORF Transcript_13101/g.46070 Transcript_13101/m.46070 type:complete len:201 (-) Transcript_13101:775-1377(-)